MIEFKYRPDIDGLRAVAVGLVLLFHAGLGLSGGFVGVDVFFVISGFLITGLIMKEQQDGSFKLSKFWVRRIRRIIPVSTFVVAMCLLAGTVLLMPSDYAELGKTAVAQQLMLSNIYFWRGTDYFGGATDLKPLLHTWSLAVEEQFYVGYPFLLALTNRLPKRYLFPSLCMLAIFSFGISEYGARRHPTAAFYLLPTRAWELLIGGLICFVPAPKSQRGGKENLASVIGILAIIASATFYSSTTPFPGSAAILPCFGAALLIYTNTEKLTWVGRILAWKPVVFVGLISYSLYLWHWPLLAFSRYWIGEKLPIWASIVALGFSFVFAFLSWKYIETPFRKGTKSVSATRCTTFAMAACSAVMMLSISMGIALSKGAQFRFSESVLVFDQRGREQVNPEFEGTVESAQRGDLPMIGSVATPSNPVDFIVWGDSHTRVVGPLFDELARKYSLKGVVAAKSRVGPLVDYKIGEPGCFEWNQAVFEVVKAKKIPNAILVARWTSIFPNEIDERKQRSIEEKQRSLETTVKSLRDLGTRVWLLDQVPEQESDSSLALWTAALLGRELPTGIPLESHLTKKAKANDIIHSLTDYGLNVLDPVSHCFDETGKSKIGDSGGSYYWDDDHLSKYGARKLLATLCESVFLEIAQSKNHSSN